MSVAQPQPQRYELQDPDVRLMLQVRDGGAVASSAAFEELVLRYQSRLITVLEHLVGNRELAEDLAQEVFLRVFRARKRYAPEARFSTWLFTIANNVASNALRSKSRRREVGVPDKINGSDTNPFGLDQMAKAASALMPTRALDKAESAQIVRLALEALNERQRLALLLSKFEGMSYQDIAQTMGLSVQAIKSLLSRARVNLERILTPYVEEGVRPDQAAPLSRGDESGPLPSESIS
ncbi:MAG TPA: sigma-70 family RNA polymerase sigma factor [Pirellulaceae bacterium]|nr:sigma-70 family RNA polymerase sigma factor [Pirellulaceae bacterium]